VASTRPYDPIDISTRAFWAQAPDQRDATFAELRRDRPISWHPPGDAALMPDASPGFWALVRHADIVAASRSETFASGSDLGGVMMEDFPQDILEATQSILSMDNPRHAQLRRLITSVFVPPRIAQIEGQIRRQAKLIVDTVAPLGEIDFVEQVASLLPMWTISEMVGIEEPDRKLVATTGNLLLSASDPEFATEGRDLLTIILECIVTLHGVANELIEKRRSVPADDVMTALTQAEIDGERLTDEEIASFFVLLCVAGNDTTRQTTSHTILALQRFPEQRAALVGDYEGRIATAVDELVRWASPVMSFRRTARVDTEIAGQPVAAGERVVMFYRSGNQDEAVFTDPLRFDLGRKPNPHVAFGGGGPHYCLGVHVAKAQLRAVFRELLFRLPDLEVGEPEYLASNFINGIKRLPARFTPVDPTD
jgi:cytochrome P450